nr:cell division/cell wall cluster transcriptional repressor MraZ [Citreicella sp. C3M06]
MRFRGESRHKVDAKGRVSIPASFRRVLEACDPDWVEGLNPNFVMVYGNEANPYIECFTIQEIERIEDQIEEMEYGDARDQLEEIYSAKSIQATVDDTGRIVIPAKLRDQFGIGAEAAMIASLNTFRIWDAELYDSDKQGRAAERTVELPKNPLTLLPRKKADVE